MPNDVEAGDRKSLHGRMLSLAFPLLERDSLAFFIPHFQRISILPLISSIEMSSLFGHRPKPPSLPIFSQDPTVTRDDVINRAWKYAGYKNYTRFVGASRSFFFVRQFRTLNVRVILAMQDGIAEMEEDLKELDDELSRKTTPDTHNGSFRKEHSEERLELIWNIKKRLENYSKRSKYA